MVKVLGCFSGQRLIRNSVDRRMCALLSTALLDLIVKSSVSHGPRGLTRINDGTPFGVKEIALNITRLLVSETQKPHKPNPRSPAEKPS